MSSFDEGRQGCVCVKSPSVNWLGQGVLIVLIVLAAIGCSANMKPASSSIQKTTLPPSVDSVGELLDAVRFDDIVNGLLELERVALDTKRRSIQANRHFTPAQEQLVDEFFAESLAVIDEELSVDRVRQVLIVTIQQSFLQRDIDTVTAFYRSRVGRAMAAKYPYELRTYVKQRQASKVTGPSMSFRRSRIPRRERSGPSSSRGRTGNLRSSSALT